ncbi:MAG TPA: MlaD family protein [Terriglobales bacterium]|jgi:phospholipid/cholesterol/gamma-HCH transport system substrate-binding protein|nr:MlaD family protein [Terriglobales bacterium]
MRRVGLIALAIAVITFAVLWGYPRLVTHRLELRVYFQNANGLRAGAPVRLAGVEVGKVTSVRARPERQAAPAEVTLSLRTPYELNIPSDSTVSLATAGVLGETFAEINVLGASGAPIKSGGILKEEPTKELTTKEIIEKVGDIVKRQPCTPQGKDTATAGTPDTGRKDHH